MCSQKQTSYNEMRLDVAHTKLRYRLIIQPTVRPQTPPSGIIVTALVTINVNMRVAIV